MERSAGDKHIITIHTDWAGNAITDSDSSARMSGVQNHLSCLWPIPWLTLIGALLLSHRNGYDIWASHKAWPPFGHKGNLATPTHSCLVPVYMRYADLIHLRYALYVFTRLSYPSRLHTQNCTRSSRFIERTFFSFRPFYEKTCLSKVHFHVQLISKCVLPVLMMLVMWPMCLASLL